MRGSCCTALRMRCLLFQLDLLITDRRNTQVGLAVDIHGLAVPNIHIKGVTMCRVSVYLVESVT